MSIHYPMQKHGRFGLGMGITFEVLHERFGFDLGQRYHADIEHRIQTNREIDRAVFGAFGPIGLGFRDPFPRATIEPFGHRFVAAMYGCECHYAAGADPWARQRDLSQEEILALPPWTVERFEQAEPVRTVLAQAAHVASHYGAFCAPDEAFNPHYRLMSSLQNLGSAINNAFSLQGERILEDYALRPELVATLFESITQLMVLCLDYFPAFDRRPLGDVAVGNCTVAMISPASYCAVNEPFDRRLMDFARAKGARFLMHQDSHATLHLEHYARLEYLDAIDFGQDTDFEKAARLMPHVAANCILFPAWLASHTLDEIREELLRLMTVGQAFRSFSFTILEIDQNLAGPRIFEFYDVFRECATA